MQLKLCENSKTRSDLQEPTRDCLVDARPRQNFANAETTSLLFPPITTHVRLEIARIKTFLTRASLCDSDYTRGVSFTNTLRQQN